MRLDKIKNILELNVDDSIKEDLILVVLATDEKVIPNILNMLALERESNKKLLIETNSLLSKADVIIKSPKLNKDNFFQKEVKEFYEENKDRLFHCFKQD